MRPFDYLRVDTVAAAGAEAAQPESRLLAGGTTLLDLMKLTNYLKLEASDTSS